MKSYITHGLAGLLLGSGLIVMSTTAMADDRTSAAAVLSKIESTAKSLNSFHAHLLATRTYSSKGNRPPMKIDETLDVTFQRPNYFAVVSKSSNEPSSYKAISDGKSVYFVSEKNYSKSSIDKTASDFHWYHDDLLLLLVTGSFEKALELPTKPKATLLPDEQWNGQSYRVVDLALGGGYPIDYKVYVGDDGIVHRVLHTETNDGHPFIEDFSVVDIEKNPQVDKGTFTFTPNADQKVIDESAFRQGEVPLISVGKAAAPFSLPTPAGPRLALRDALEGKKALLLNFWFVHCPPCRAEHPKLEKLYRELKGKGLDVLSVDDQDTPEDVAKYWKRAGLTFRTVLSGPMAAIDPKTGYPNYGGPKLPDYASLVPYGVHECPMNILLNAQGAVVYVSSGWDEAGLRKALEQLAVK